MLPRNSFVLKPLLWPAEKTMLVVAVFALFVNAVLISVKDANVDFIGYTGIAAVVLGLLAGGMFYRKSERSEEIASAMICAGAFIFFSACISMFNYLLLPLGNGTWDHTLATWDQVFGYHWPDIMALAAEFPTITFILKLAYMSTILQITVLVVVLGLFGRFRDLHILLSIVTITATLSICFWGLFPTLGPTVLYTLPQEVWSIVNPTVNANYGTELIRVAEHGPGVITPSEIRGLIGFPSYHAVLAFAAIYAARNVKYLASAFWALNLLILPSIFVHGGHHFVDLPAGFAVFLIGVWAANRALDARSSTKTEAVSVMR